MKLVFKQKIKRLINKQSKFIVIHSSVANTILFNKNNKKDLIESLKELYYEGYNIALPSFTFSYCEKGVYDLAKSKSETGVLPELIQINFPEAVRTIDPVYSFVCLGKDLNKFNPNKELSAFGNGSIFEFFEIVNANIVLIDIGWNYCTQFHRYEEINKVPYRSYKLFNGIIRNKNKTLKTTKKIYVRDLELNPINDFSPIIKFLTNKNKIKTINYQNIKIQSTSIKHIYNASNKILKKDALALLKNKSQINKKLFYKNENKNNFTIYLLGSSNLDICYNYFINDLKKLLPDREFIIKKIQYGQITQEILNPDSDLMKSNCDLTIFSDRLEDLMGTNILESLNENKIFNVVNDYIELIYQYLKKNSNYTIVHQFFINNSSSLFNKNKLFNFVSRCNSSLDKKLKNFSNIIYLNMFIESQGIEKVFDNRLWSIGKIPFSNQMSKKLSKRWSSITISIVGKKTKLIVLDLDNTIWGGVLGEDGLENIKIGGDHPGNSFKDFQILLKDYSEKGIILATCSKNDSDLVYNVFNNHKEMILKKNDFAAHQINWKPKNENLKKISSDIGLGLDSFLFVDDNPIEREIIRRKLPDVKILDLPDDPADYTDALRNCIWLETFKVSEIDKNRLNSYKVKDLIDKNINKKNNIEDYLSQLNIEVFFKKLQKDNIDRAQELCNKTNQFNTTTIRYNSKNLKSIVKKGDDVAVIGYMDDYTLKENIGLVIIKRDQQNIKTGHIDLLLLSCRYMGRNIENLIVKWCLSRAKERGLKKLYGKIINSERNTPVRDIYKKNNFKKIKKEDLYLIDNFEYIYPSYFKISDDFKVRKKITTQKNKIPFNQKFFEKLVMNILKLNKKIDLINGGLGVTPKWDSLKHIEIILGIESHFGIKFKSKDIEKVSKFKNLLSLTKKLV